MWSMVPTGPCIYIMRVVKTALFTRRKPVSLFFRDAIERVNRHREEQIALDNKILEIMAKSKKRREDFRAVWGFSPKSINRKRSVKTVFNVHQIKMSEDAPEPNPADEGGEIQDM